MRGSDESSGERRHGYRQTDSRGREAASESQETVLWSGRPNPLALAISALPISLGGLIWLSVPAAALQLMLSRPDANPTASMVGMRLALIPFFAIGVAMLFAPLFRFVAGSRTEYLITRRHIIRSVRWVGHRLTTLERRHVVLTRLIVSLADRRLGTGSIVVYAADPVTNRRAAAVLRAELRGIEDPTRVLRLLNGSIEGDHRGI